MIPIAAAGTKITAESLLDAGALSKMGMFSPRDHFMVVGKSSIRPRPKAVFNHRERTVPAWGAASPSVPSSGKRKPAKSKGSKCPKAKKNLKLKRRVGPKTTAKTKRKANSPPITSIESPTKRARVIDGLRGIKVPKAGIGKKKKKKSKGKGKGKGKGKTKARTTTSLMSAVTKGARFSELVDSRSFSVPHVRSTGANSLFVSGESCTAFE
jgi:hypothetical protein